MEQTKFDVFISYSSKDKTVAEKTLKQRYIFFCLLFLLTVCPLHAQQLNVKELKVAPNDPAATQYPVKDRNQQNCALVIVNMVVDGAKFEGNIIKQERKANGEYWVYVTEGTMDFTIYTNDYLAEEVDFQMFGIRGLKSGTTYKMKVERELIQSERNNWVDSNTKILGKWSRDNVSTATSQELDRENVMFEFKKEGALKYTYVHQIENRTFKAKYKAIMNGSYSIAKDSVFILFNTFDYDDGISVKRKDGYLVTDKFVDDVKDQMSEEFRYIGHGLYRKVRLILLDKREMIFEMGNNEITSERKQEKYIRK